MALIVMNIAIPIGGRDTAFDDSVTFWVVPVQGWLRSASDGPDPLWAIEAQLILPETEMVRVTAEQTSVLFWLAIGIFMVGIAVVGSAYALVRRPEGRHRARWALLSAAGVLISLASIVMQLRGGNAYANLPLIFTQVVFIVAVVIGQSVSIARRA